MKRSDVPSVTGGAAGVLRRAVAVRAVRDVVAAVGRHALGVAGLADLPLEWRGPLPHDPRPLRARPAPRRWDAAGLPAVTAAEGAWPRRADALRAAFRAGQADPRDVVERALAQIARLAAARPATRLLAATCEARARSEAAAAAARYAAGTPRALDGVPALVKDHVDVAGLPTCVGARYVPAPAACDATLVARLSAAGAALLGKTEMTELGISPLGTAAHQRLPRNVFAPGRAAGGSSTGSAVAVALGLAPFASGSDAGGSVRIPASLNGVYGLKPTFGRVSRAGEALGGSVNTVGVIGASAADLAHFLDAVAREQDPSDPLTAWAAPAPEGGFGARMGDGVRGLRIGVDESEWLDAAPDVARAGRAALAALERDGAELVAVHLPLARHAPPIGVVTVGAEGAAVSREMPREMAALLGDDVQLAMTIGAASSVGDFLDAQRLRVTLARQLAAVLAEVDVLALPTVPSGAPALPENAPLGSASDMAAVAALCRYAFLANLTGVPAGTAPVGFDRAGVPIGLQIVGDAWDEAAVLAVLAHLERTGYAAARPPGALDLLASGAGTP